MSNNTDDLKGAGEITNEEKRNPRGIYKGTREEWLEEAAQIMGVWVDEYLDSAQKEGKFGKTKKADFFARQKVKYSCSLLDGGLTASRAGAHCHYAQSTGNGYHEIRMGVELGGRKKKAESSRVADILLHEMIHTISYGHGHKGLFRWCAVGVGLEGKMTSTVASKECKEKIDGEVLKVLGRYPHKAVKLLHRGQRGKGSPLKKCYCRFCEINFRMSHKNISLAYATNEPQDDMGEYMMCPSGCGPTVEVDC